MPDHYTPNTKMPLHIKGTTRGTERIIIAGKQPGCEKEIPTARNLTSINPRSRGPIDKKMPHMPPA
jgi:hypothetical protein